MNLLSYMMLPHNIEKEENMQRWILVAYRKTGGGGRDNFPHESFISGYTEVFFFLFVMALIRIQKKPMQEEEVRFLPLGIAYYNLEDVDSILSSLNKLHGHSIQPGC